MSADKQDRHVVTMMALGALFTITLAIGATAYVMFTEQAQDRTGYA